MSGGVTDDELLAVTGLEDGDDTSEPSSGGARKVAIVISVIIVLLGISALVVWLVTSKKSGASSDSGTLRRKTSACDSVTPYFCSKNGVCVESGVYYDRNGEPRGRRAVCKCAPGYHGSRCERKCDVGDPEALRDPKTCWDECPEGTVPYGSACVIACSRDDECGGEGYGKCVEGRCACEGNSKGERCEVTQSAYSKRPQCRADFRPFPGYLGDCGDNVENAEGGGLCSSDLHCGGGRYGKCDRGKCKCAGGKTFGPNCENLCTLLPSDALLTEEVKRQCSGKETPIEAELRAVKQLGSAEKMVVADSRIQSKDPEKYVNAPPKPPPGLMDQHYALYGRSPQASGWQFAGFQ